MKSEVQPHDRAERTATADKLKAAADRNGTNGAALRRPDSLAGTARRLSRRPLAALGQPRHRPAPFARTFMASTTARSPLMATDSSGSSASRTTNRFPHLHLGWSDDGLDWHIEPKAIQFAERRSRPRPATTPTIRAL